MGGGLSMLKGNYWPPLEVVAESGNKGGDNEENDDAIEDPLGSPSVLSSVESVLFVTSERSMTSPVFLSIGMHSCVHEIHNCRRCRCKLWN
jgi:hypothetical protein